MSPSVRGLVTGVAWSAVALGREGGRPDNATILLRYDQARFEAMLAAALAAG